MKVYTVKREQWIHRPVEEVFPFFADAANLEKLTPAWLHFSVLSPQPVAMHEGAMIAYRLGWHGLPLKWLTEITAWEPPHRFIDEQRKGPYALWRHTHEFRPQADGVLICDHVQYALPLGVLGQIAHWLTVHRDVNSIFDYRVQKVNELFGVAAEAHLGPTLP